MIVVSARQFRENQTKILNAAINGRSIVLTSRLGNFKISPITEYDNIVESSLRSAHQEVQDHIQGKIDLPLAKDIVF